jgi:hypothetical protein
LAFLANHIEVQATTVAALYENCWQIEMYMSLRFTLGAACGRLSRVARLLRWVNQHLRGKTPSARRATR